MIERFISHAKAVFDFYQVSNMRISKWRTKNLVVNVLQVCDIIYLDAGLYEDSRKRFKEEYKNSSETRRKAMDEISANVLMVKLS